MARHWEKFTDGPTISSRDRFHVTLNSKGVFQFNRKVFEALGKPRAAVLYFEKATSTIGIGPAQERLREAFPVNIRQEMYWTINAIPFCRHFGIKIDRGTEAFADPELNDEGILQLDLRTTRRVYGGGGKRPKKNPADAPARS
jgi:hypothetical protein